MKQTKEQPRRRSSGKRIAVRITVLAFSLLFILSGLGLTYIQTMLSRIDRTEIKGNPSLSVSELIDQIGKSDTTISIDIDDSIAKIKNSQEQYEKIKEMPLLQNENITNILLIGSDSRNENSTAGLSDSMMIVSINHLTKKIHISSLMRTMFVNIPGYRWFALNASHSWGGPKLLLQTIENNFRVKIDEYVVINFAHFEEVIDAVGGVDVTITEAEARYLHSYWKTRKLEAGPNTLSGYEALGFARTRGIDTDFRRTGRQRMVIESLMKKATHMNLMQLHSFAYTLLPLINTSLSDNEILNLATSAPNYAGYEISQMMLPIENDPNGLGKNDPFHGIMMVDGLECYKVDYYTNIKALHEFIVS